MGLWFSWFLGKTETELKEMRDRRIEKLAKESDVEKVEGLVKEIEAIDGELAKLAAEDESK